MGSPLLQHCVSSAVALYVGHKKGPPNHAARAKFSGIGKQSAAILNSNGKVAYLSAANVVAVCEDGRPLSFFGATAPLGWPCFLSGVTGLSSLERKIAVDTPVTSGLFLACSAARFRR